MAILVVSGTTRCNLNCKHCFRQRHEKPVDLSLSLFKSILVQSLKYKIDHIGLTGGEMMLHPQFKEYAELISSTGIGWSVVSNGYNWDEIKQNLYQHRENIRYIAFSLDGLKRTHDWLRGSGSYDKVVHAISDSNKLGFNTRTCMVIGSHNFGEIEEVAHLGLKLGCQALVFSTILPTPHNKELVLTPQKRKEAHEILIRLQNTFRQTIIISADFVGIVGIPHCCTLDGSNITIDSWGNLCVCCELVDFTRLNVKDRPDIICSLVDKSLDEGMKIYMDWISNFKKWKIDNIEFLDDIYDNYSCFTCLRYINNGLDER